MLEKLKELKDGVLDAVLPAACVSCGTEGRYICEKCEIFLVEASFICPFCRQASFAGERHVVCAPRHGLDGLASIWEYEGAVQRLLHLIKYNGVAHTVEEVVERACDSMMLDQKRFAAFLSFLFFPDTLVAYVPMHRRKEKHRGFNQTELFANALAKRTKNKVVRLLEKSKETKPQVDLNKEERLYNVQESFVFSARSDLPDIKKVVLVDDIWTTGATMKECCKVLKKAGIQEVWGFTLARTP
jgi:competence protein ComFC